MLLSFKIFSFLKPFRGIRRSDSSRTLKMFAIFEESPVLSQSGSLTVQFLLGFVLCLCFVMLFSVMTLTLAVSEITQYITYSASRTLFLGDGTKDLQQKGAMEKYGHLATTPPFNKLFQGTSRFFEIADQGDLSREGHPSGVALNYRRFPESSQVPHLFYGVWTKFIPKVMQIRLPLWGEVKEDSSFFETAVGSYLGREPSGEECKQFIDKRWEFISSKLGGIPSGIDPAGFYEKFYDNGC